MRGGSIGAPSDSQLDQFARETADRVAAGLKLSVDDRPTTLAVRSQKATAPAGAGGMATLRVECELEAPAAATVTAQRVTLTQEIDADRQGWREMVVAPGDGVAVWNSTAFGTSASNELRAYPEANLESPLDERRAEFLYRTGSAPPGTSLLTDRENHPLVGREDALAALVGQKELSPVVMLVGLLLAFVWGAGHALSPGHGKTVVGAYLVGSRGTWKHAVFLGMTVTITHTLGVFALGLITLFASQFILPEKIMPVLELVSGLIVLGMGAGLFTQRLAALTSGSADTQAADHGHSHDQGHSHSHGGTTHSHDVPGADGESVTWKSLLALGISGGLLPCPSALLALLLSISLGRVAYGLVLVISFSLGLAATLTLIGLLFLKAGHLLKERVQRITPITRWLPVGSALIIACVGAALCYQTLATNGWAR